MSAVLEFFTMPDEQQDWLSDLLSAGKTWCLVDDTRTTQTYSCHFDKLFLNDIEFTTTSRGSLRLYLGLSELCQSPRWRDINETRQSLDLIKSQAISYNPSLVAAGFTLLEGHMGIMREVYYREAGIDPRPVQKWFRHVVDSFRKLHASNARLIHRGQSGKITAYPKVAVTQGAIDWYNSGRKLKQFVDGNVEFDLQLTD